MDKKQVYQYFWLIGKKSGVLAAPQTENECSTDIKTAVTITDLVDMN